MKKTAVFAVLAAFIGTAAFAGTHLGDVTSPSVFKDRVTFEKPVKFNGEVKLDGRVLTKDGVGAAANTAYSVATESYVPIHETTIVLTDLPISVTDLTATTNSCGGTPIYTFPAGQIYILGFQVENFECATNVSIDAADGGDYAFGTSVGTGPDLSTTEMDLTDAKVSIDPITNIVDAVSALDSVAESYFDGTATPIKVYCNLLIDGGDIATNVTMTASATVKIKWANLGDD